MRNGSVACPVPGPISRADFPESSLEYSTSVYMPHNNAHISLLIEYRKDHYPFSMISLASWKEANF